MDRLCIEALKNDMVEAIKKVYSHDLIPHVERLKLVYSQTLPGNAMRRLLVDITAFRLAYKTNKFPGEYKEMIRHGGDVILNLMTGLHGLHHIAANPVISPFAQTCAYHEHLATAKCNS